MRWRVLGLGVVLAVTSCRKAAERGEDEVTRAMALGAIADLERAVATAATRAGTPDGGEGVVRCASLATTRNDLRETPYRDLADRLDRLCDGDVPAAELTAALALIEAEPARCATLAMTKQLELLAGAPAPEHRDLVTRYRARCPSQLPPVPDHGADGAVP